MNLDWMMNYLIWLAAFSALVLIFELLWPARSQQTMRRWLWSDGIHLIFNGHFFGLLLYGIATYHVLPHVDGFLSAQGLKESFYFAAVNLWGWGLITQTVVAFFILDFVQWLVHNTLHRVNFLWKIHQVHHSVKDGEMDWIVSFRFSWIEPVIYKSVMYLPMIWFGFAPEALMFHAVFGTLIGHLNHANLTWDYGPLRYVFNSPRMHLYHHAYDAPAHGQNFGISLSCWDWIFGTAHLPDEPCPKIGFPGVEALPNDFFGQLVWPLPLYTEKLIGTKLVTSGLGVVLLACLYGASLPPSIDTPMFGEPAASSQPAALTTAAIARDDSPEGLATALSHFGDEAKRRGWSRPEWSVSARELAMALGAPALVILDVRTPARFAAGHIPSAQLVTRADYSGGEVPGLSFSAEQLTTMLQRRGVGEKSQLVLMGDGGPEPYRLWWTLWRIGGYEARVLDGGLAAWKAIGQGLAEGPGREVEAGDLVLPGRAGEPRLWSELVGEGAAPQLLDTRSPAEFAGTEQHRKAARAGRIPKAKHMIWHSPYQLIDGVPTLRSPAEVREVVAASGVDLDAPLITYCQSGTRSAAVYYALLQSGLQAEQVQNYDGSWAEYSRLSRPIER